MTKKLRDKADQITSIRQYLVVNWLITGGHRSSLDLKDRGTNPYLQGSSNVFGRDHCLQFIVCFDQGDSIFFLEKSEDRLQPQIVVHNLLSKVKGQIRLIKRDRRAIGQPYPLDPHHLCPFGQLKAFCNPCRGGNNILTDHTRSGFSPGCIHILNEAC